MTPEQREELKPCPFCGDAGSQLIQHVEGTIIHPAYFVKCDNCGAVGPTTDRGDHRELWNRRAQVEALTVPDDYFAPVVLNPTCACAKCNPNAAGRMMILCATCGNKRCPHATDHRLACTDSNEPGQPGSSYGPTIPAIPGTKEGA